MDTALLILIAACFGGFLMAFSLGANDVSNSMASPVGSKAITIRQALYIASILNFAGAVFLGSHVAATICTGIIDPTAIQDQHTLMLGMFSALLSSGLWVLIATYTALPVSSTHSIVGSIAGFGLAVGGYEVVQWGSIIRIILSWVISPFFGILIGYLVFTHIRRTILFSADLIQSAKRWAPMWVALTLFMVAMSLCFMTPWGKSLGITWVHGLVITITILIFSVVFCRKYLFTLTQKEKRPRHAVDELFRRMQVGTACYVALSQGASDVSNAIGPLVAIYYIAVKGGLTDNLEIPLWLLAMGGVGIATGIVTMGHKVMTTVGERIIKINNTRGFSIDFSAATTVLMASNLGLPVSSTHATVGAVVGVGLARGFSAVDFRILGKILTYWILTVPIAGFSCIIIYQLLRWLIPGS